MGRDVALEVVVTSRQSHKDWKIGGQPVATLQLHSEPFLARAEKQCLSVEQYNAFSSSCQQFNPDKVSPGVLFTVVNM